MESATGSAVERRDSALDWVRLVSEDIGPRRPTGAAERRAAHLVADRLAKAGLSPRMQQFPAHPTFALPYGGAIALALIGAPFSRRYPLGSSAAAAAGALLTSAEDSLGHRPLTRLVSRREGRNVVATSDPAGRVERTACLVCHLDTSRSGLMFHRRFLPLLHAWIGVQAAAFAGAAAAPLLRRLPGGGRIVAGSYAVLAAGLALLIERELRGVEVPGANDNASGVAAVAVLAAELSAAPLANTRVLCLFTGGEEAGVLGADAFLRDLESARQEWRSWLFVNFDGVAAPATLRFLRHEGVLRKWRSDPRLVAIAERIASRRPELRLQPGERNAGLTYDTSPVIARGGRGITLSAQDRTIPNYHAATDVAENADPDTLARALEVGREILAAIDRGEAD